MFWSHLIHVISRLLIIPFYSTFAVCYKHAGLNTATKSSAISILTVFVDQKQVIEGERLVLFVTVFLTGESW